MMQKFPTTFKVSDLAGQLLRCQGYKTVKSPRDGQESVIFLAQNEKNESIQFFGNNKLKSFLQSPAYIPGQPFMAKV